MWTSLFVSYGAIQIHGSEIWVYKDRWNYVRVQCNRPVERAYWSGNYLVVSLADGTLRRYLDYMKYEAIG